MTWLNSILVIGHTKRILYGDIIKVFGLLSEYRLSFSLCNLLFSCEKYNTIKHKSTFQKLCQKYGAGRLGFLSLSIAFLVQVAACLLPFTPAGGARCVLFILSSWLGLGWTWASNICLLNSLIKIHSCWLNFLWKVIWVKFKFSLRVMQIYSCLCAISKLL